MKRITSVIIVLLVIINLLCSCENSINNENSGSDVLTDESTEDFYDYYSHCPMSNCDFFETKDGYYYLNYKSHLVYYSEKGKTDFVILCNKPDCDHSDENCNAYAGKEIGYYNGKIYGVKYARGNGYELIRMDLDGTNHEKVADMPVAKSPNGSGGSVSGGIVFFYKGFLITFNNITVDRTTAYPVAYKVELETGKSTLLFDDELSKCSSLVVNFYPYKNYIWFEVGYRKEAGGYYYCADLDTCEIIHIIKDEGMSEISVRNGLLYYYKNDTGFCEYNPDTKEEKLLKQYDYNSAGVIYGDNYYVAMVNKLKDDEKDSDNWIILFDKSYNNIAQVELPTYNVTNMAIVSVTSDFIFLFEGNTASTGITHYIDLNKITDGKMTVEKIQ